MSKLDRQIDEANAVAPLKIVWHAFDDVDADVLRQQLRTAILSADRRVPLDCRDVDGAPDELVEILLNANDYAKERSKQVTLSFASDELRQALRPGVHRRTSRDPGLVGKRVDAASAAAESLHERVSSYTQPEAKPTAKLSIAPSGKSKDRFRLVKLASLVLLGAAFLGGLEWYLVFNEEETIDISQYVENQQAPPVKTFESGEQPE